MGAFGTFDYLADYPNLFAAAVPISGGGSPSAAHLFKDVPLWAFHGDQDATVNVSNTRNMITALNNAGGHPLYTEIPGGSHEIGIQIYNDAATQQYGLYDWMFAQTNPNAALAVSIPEPSTLCLGLFAAGALTAVTKRQQR
jgi:predicted peptidase